MTYLVRNSDYNIAVLDTANDNYISFKPLNENLFCIGGCLLYNFTTYEHIKVKFKELNICIDDYSLLQFNDVLQLALTLHTEQAEK